jgi:hypothetical protein
MARVTILTAFKPYCKAEKGVAAIEFAFILPFLLFLYFGLLDLTGLVSANRKMTSTASVVADLTGQNRTTITEAEITDFMLVSEMINNPAPGSGVRVRVTGFRNSGGAATQIWTTNNGEGPACNAPDTSGLVDLMSANNDIIIAQACMTYEPAVASFLGKAILGATEFNVQQDIMVRPRSTAQLTCSDC